MGLAVTSTTTDTALLVPIGVAVIAATVGVITLIANAAANKKAVRRKLYTDAYRAVVKRLMFVNRVRTRTTDSELSLAESYWDVLEEIRYYEGALRAESRRMGDAFHRLSRTVAAVSDPALLNAWAARPVPAAEAHHCPQPPAESYDAALTSYIIDAHSNSSGWVVNRIGSERRYQARRRADRVELRRAWTAAVASRDLTDTQRAALGDSFERWMNEFDKDLVPLRRREAVGNGLKEAVLRKIPTSDAPGGRRSDRDEIAARERVQADGEPPRTTLSQ